MPRRCEKPRLRRSFALPAPGFPAGPRAKNVIPSQMVARLTTSGRAKVWRVFSVLRCQWGANCIRGKRLIIGGCHHMPRRCEKPRLRRSFALPEPGFPRGPALKVSSLRVHSCSRQTTDDWGVPPYAEATRKAPAQNGAAPYLSRLSSGTTPENPEKFLLSDYNIPPVSKSVARIFCFTMSMGVHIVRDERLDWGVPPHAEATRKAPAQTELRPTCAGVPAPTYVPCMGDAQGMAARESPGSGGGSPYLKSINQPRSGNDPKSGSYSRL